MDSQNLVLEISDNESAATIEDRLNAASADGYFLVNVVGRLAFLRRSITQKSALVGDDLPVNADAVTVLKKVLAGKARVTLQELRRIGRFDKFPEKEWYRALQSLVEAGLIVLREEQTARGHKRTVVLASAKCPS